MIWWILVTVVALVATGALVYWSFSNNNPDEID